MTYWQGVLSRLNAPGLMLMAAGVALCLGAGWLSGVVWKQGGDRAVMPLKVIGLALAVVGALISLQIIPV